MRAPSPGERKRRARTTAKLAVWRAQKEQAQASQEAEAKE